MIPDLMDENLLFGLIAMQSDLIEMRQFVDACTLWGSRKESSLADILVENGWLNDEDRQHVSYLLRRRIEKSGGDAKQSLAKMPDGLKDVLQSIGDENIRSSLGGAERISTTRAISPNPQSPSRITRRDLHSTGGIGHVWLAHDKVLDREIALKELKAKQSESPINRERFFREAQITAQLTHPGTVPIYDYVEDGQQSYYTMKFVRGRTLSECIAEYHSWRNESKKVGVTSRLVQLLNQFVAICNTIAFAHSQRIIHRDLKSENVVVGDFGEVVVLDWGLAKRIGEIEATSESPSDEIAATMDIDQDRTHASASHTIQGDKLGTPAYMSPEQARGEIDLLDERTDVYGLAAILYEILVGNPPFQGTSIVAVLEDVIHDRPKSPSDCVDGIPKEIERICLRGLSKKRNDRQQTAAAVAEEIQTWIVERAERQRTEQERERFFNLSLDLLTILDASGRLTQSNPAWQTLLGWTAEELQSKPIWDMLAPEDYHRAVKNHEQILAGESLTEIEYRCLRKDGSYCWILWNAKLIPGESSIYLVGRDITERKRSEQTFRDLLESAPDAMVVVNESGTIVLVNSQLEQMFGYDRSELLGGPIETLVPRPFRAEHPKKVAEFVASASVRPMAAGLELHAEHKSGSVFPVEISLSPVQSEQGMLISCAVRDVTNQKKEQQKLQGILDASPDAMVIADSDRRIVLVNIQTERLFEYDRKELVGQLIEVLIPERLRIGHPEMFDTYAKSPQYRPMGAGRTLCGRAKSGREFEVAISLSALDSSDGTLFISTIRNVTS
ncbi:MAG: PAS domain S-box protein [bacterium]|nr:PAS domain S-box protein [bacterium]